MTEQLQQTKPNDHKYYPEDEIELIDYLRVLWKWKFLIIFMVAFCSLAAAGYKIIKYPPKYITECTIEMNFQGISKNQNPDGSRFDKNQIISPHILSEAILSLKNNNNESSVENIREFISVNAIYPSNLKEMRKSAEAKGEVFTFFPNRFKLSFLIKDKDVFTVEEKEQILLAIIDEYRISFNRKYGEEPLVAVKFPTDFLSKYDYIEIINLFKLRTNHFIDLLDFKIKNAGFFKSKTTGLTFSDLKYETQVIKDIEISGAEAIIKNRKLTKDRTRLIEKYKNQLRTIELSKSKKESEALVAIKLLREMRQPGSSKALAIKKEKGEASVVVDSSFIQHLRENDYFSLLLKTAMGAGIEAGNLEAEKINIEQEIISLNKMAAKKDQNKIINGNKSSIREVNGLFEKLRDRIENLSQKANDLNREYLNYSVDNAITIAETPTSNTIRSNNPLKTAILSGIVAFFCSIFFIFFCEYVKSAIKQPNII